MRTALAGLGEQVPSPNAVLASFLSAQAAPMAPEQTRGGGEGSREGKFLNQRPGQGHLTPGLRILNWAWKRAVWDGQAAVFTLRGSHCGSQSGR